MIATISKGMVMFWIIAARDWREKAKRAKLARRHRLAHDLHILTGKAESQILWIQEKRQMGTKSGDVRIGTHGRIITASAAPWV